MSSEIRLKRIEISHALENKHRLNRSQRRMLKMLLKTRGNRKAAAVRLRISESALNAMMWRIRRSAGR